MKEKDQIVIFLSRLIPFFLIPVPLFAAFSSALVNLCLGICMAAYVSRKVLLKDFRTPLRHPATLPFLLIFLFSLVSFVNTVSLRASLQGIGKLFRYWLVVVMASEALRDTTHLRRIVLSAVLGLFLVSLNGIVQLYTGLDPIRQRTVLETIGLPRITSSFSHPNMLGVYLVLFLPLGISMAGYHDRGWRKGLSFLACTLALFCLFGSFSRASFLGFLAAIIWIAVSQKDKILGFGLLVMALLIPLALPQNIREYRKTTTSVWEFLLERRKIGDFRNAWNMIRHNPLTGVGINTYSLNLKTYQIRDGSRFVSDTEYAHNSYLQMAAEIGLFGLAAFFWFVGRLFRSGVRCYRMLADPFLKTATLGFLTGTVAFLFNGLMETTLYYSKMVSLFWLEAGLLFGMSRFSGAPHQERAL